MTSSEVPSSPAALPLGIERTALGITKLRPQRVALSRSVLHPKGVLRGFGDTAMDAIRGDAQLVLDMGRTIVGRAAVQIAVERGATLEMRYGETLDEALQTETLSSNAHHLPVDRYTRELGPWVIHSQGRRLFRYLHLRIPQGQGRVDIQNLWAEHEQHPTEPRGTFYCSDPILNTIWEASRDRLGLSMQQVYEHSAREEGVLRLDSYRVQFLANAFGYGDGALARKSLVAAASAQLPDGSLPSSVRVSDPPEQSGASLQVEGAPESSIWVNSCCDLLSGLKEYYVYTGDLETVQHLWPTVTGILRYLTVDLELQRLAWPASFYTDQQPDIKPHGWGSLGALIMQIYWALSDASLLARVLAVSQVVALCATTQSLLRRHLRAGYYAEDRELYTDEAGPTSGTSWHVNALAILSGLVSDSRQTRGLLERIMPLLDARRPVSGSAAFWSIIALHAAGMAPQALREQRLFWGALLEAKALPGWAGHAHHVGPAFLLPRFALGVQPTAPGFERVQIRPQLGDLEWAEGIVPTPRGNIHVHWEARPRLRGRIILPEGIEGEAIQTRGASHVSRQLRPGENEIT